MKIRPFFTFCAAIVAGVVFIVWCMTEPVVQVIAEPEAKQSAPAKPINMPISTTGSIVAATAQLTNATATPHRNPQEEIREILATQNDVPIDFYGRLQDQFGDSVPNAKINCHVMINRGEGIKTKDISTTSDANGFFQFNAGRGEGIGISRQKQGYALATTQTAFEYSHMRPGYFVPDPNNPVVIKMWKLQGAEHLINFNIHAYVPVDGSPIFYNLNTGQRVQDHGDILLYIKSSEAPNLGQGYDWQAHIQPTDGGIIQVSNIRFEQMFQAPESGYNNQFDLDYRNEISPWSSRFRGNFYFKIHGGKYYGKFIVTITTDAIKDRSVPITLTGYINPEGSRNLEVDPKLVTESKP